jgi:hypothetical protein
LPLGLFLKFLLLGGLQLARLLFRRRIVEALLRGVVAVRLVVLVLRCEDYLGACSLESHSLLFPGLLRLRATIAQKLHFVGRSLL